jgi:putative ABC transport system permease protein
LEERLAGVPVFSAVTVASHAPLASGGAPRELAIEGSSASAGATLPTVSGVYTGALYFETLGVQLRRGRDFTEADGLPGGEAAIIDERLAALYFTGTDPIGRRIRLLSRDSTNEGRPVLTIIGVAPAIPDFSPGRSLPVVYMPARAEATRGRDLSVIVRANTGLTASVSRLRDEVRALDPDLPLYGIETVDAAAARSRSPQRLVGTWFGIIAFIAVALSTVGIYGLTAYGVAQRTHEIGVRMALGARAHQVTWLFLRRTAVHLAIGLALGVFGALATGQLLQSLLVQTDARDPLTLAGVVALLAFVAIVASLVPSRRAARLDPVAALRAD